MALQRLEPGQEVLLEDFAFHPAHPDQGVDGIVEGLLEIAPHGGRIEARLRRDEDFLEPRQRPELDLVLEPQLFLYLQQQGVIVAQQGHVEAVLDPVVRAGFRIGLDAHLDAPAEDPLAHPFLDVHLERGKDAGQAGDDLDVAVVEGFDLDDPLAPLDERLRTSVTGHAEHRFTQNAGSR